MSAIVQALQLQVIVLDTLVMLRLIGRLNVIHVELHGLYFFPLSIFSFIYSSVLSLLFTVLKSSYLCLSLLCCIGSPGCGLRSLCTL